MDNFEDMYCEGCNERIYERNFDAANRNDDTAAICEECLEKGKHLRCMDDEDRAYWEFDRIWVCSACIDELSSHSSDLSELNNLAGGSPTESDIAHGLNASSSVLENLMNNYDNVQQL